MRKLIIFLVTGILWCNVSFAQSMISLKQYVKDNSNYAEDPIVQTYVLKRCSAAYLYAAAITKDKDKNMAAAFVNAYQKVSIFAVEVLMHQMNWSEEVAGKSLITDMDKMVKYYEKDGNDSFARTGNYMMENYIGEDLKFCKGVVESIK